MKKITLILAMMMVVLSVMAAGDGPKYSFMKGFPDNRQEFKRDINHNEGFDVQYNSNSAGTAAINYDAINSTQAPATIFRFGMGSNHSAGSSISGGSASASSGVSVGDNYTVTGKGTALSSTLKDGTKRTTRQVTLGFNGHTALFGDEIIPPTDGENNNQGEPVRPPLGNAHAPIMMAIMALAWVIYKRRR